MPLSPRSVAHALCRAVGLLGLAAGSARAAEPLVSAAWLATQATNRHVMVLDIRPADEHLAGHIPGAVSADFATTGWMVPGPGGAAGALPPVERIAATIGALAVALVVTTNIAGQPCGWGRHIFWGGFPRAMFSFYLGVALREIWAAGRLPRLGWPLAPLLAVVLISLAPESKHLFLYVALFGGPLIVCVAIANPRSTRLAKAFDALGQASYPVYALHLPAFGLMKLAYDRATGALWDQPPPLAMDLLLAPLVFVACLWLARRFDAPLRRRLTLRRAGVGSRMGAQRESASI